MKARLFRTQPKKNKQLSDSCSITAARPKEAHNWTKAAATRAKLFANLDVHFGTHWFSEERLWFGDAR